MGNPLSDADGFVSLMGEYAALGIDQVDLVPEGDPVAFTTDVCESIVPRLAALG